jgi:hypothetical protein
MRTQKGVGKIVPHAVGVNSPESIRDAIRGFVPYWRADGRGDVRFPASPPRTIREISGSWHGHKAFA